MLIPMTLEMAITVLTITILGKKTTMKTSKEMLATQMMIMTAFQIYSIIALLE